MIHFCPLSTISTSAYWYCRRLKTKEEMRSAGCPNQGPGEKPLKAHNFIKQRISGESSRLRSMLKNHIIWMSCNNLTEWAYDPSWNMCQLHWRGYIQLQIRKIYWLLIIRGTIILHFFFPSHCSGKMSSLDFVEILLLFFLN